MTLTPNQKERIIQKVLAIGGRVNGLKEKLEGCKNLKCPCEEKMRRYVEAIGKAASEINKELD